MSGLIRNGLNRAYGRSRSLDNGFDSRLSDLQVLSFAARKASHAVSGLIRFRRLAFVAPSARIRSRRMLRLGELVSIAEGVIIDAASAGGVHLGARVTIDVHAVLRGSGVLRRLGEGITIGERTSIGAFNFLHGGGGIKVGNDCLFGPGVKIFSENHLFARRDIPIREQGEQRAPVEIGNDVWIGADSIVLAGVTIGHGAVIAASTVVNRDVPPFAVFAGVPARRVGTRGGGHE